MKIETKEIYKCDYCNKPYQRKSACIEHEPKCTKNPINIPKCNDCKHLERVEMKFEASVQTGRGDDLLNGHCFKCNLKDIFMYPPKVEHGMYGVPDYATVEGEEISQERMPIKCDDFKGINDEWNELF